MLIYSFATVEKWPILSASKNFFSVQVLNTFGIAIDEIVAYRFHFQTHNSSFVKDVNIESLLINKQKCTEKYTENTNA